MRFNAVRAEVLSALRDGATVVHIWEALEGRLQMSYEQFNRYARTLRREAGAGGETRVHERAQDRVAGAQRPEFSDGPRAPSAPASPMAVLHDLPGRETKGLI